MTHSCISFPASCGGKHPQSVREKLSRSSGGYSLGRRRQEPPCYQLACCSDCLRSSALQRRAGPHLIGSRPPGTPTTMSSPSRHGLNFKCRGSGHLTDIAVAGGLHRIPFIRIPISSHATECPRTSLKAGLKKEI